MMKKKQMRIELTGAEAEKIVSNWIAGRVEPVFRRLRYWLIEALAGDMPVVLNMVVSRPKRFDGSLVRFPRPDLPGLFINNVLLSESREEILITKRDTWEPNASDQAGEVRILYAKGK